MRLDLYAEIDTLVIVDTMEENALALDLDPDQEVDMVAIEEVMTVVTEVLIIIITKTAALRLIGDMITEIAVTTTQAAE